MLNKILFGHDELGRVMLEPTEVTRSINQEYHHNVERLLTRLAPIDTDALGLVPFTFHEEAACIHHPRLPISYPHEWTPSMFRAAARFQLDFTLSLQPHGLICKDAIPQNILFDGCTPFFVDLYSLLPNEDFPQHRRDVQPYLADTYDPACGVLASYFWCYFMVPLALYHLGESSAARRVLQDYACNTGCQPKLEHIAANFRVPSMSNTPSLLRSSLTTAWRVLRQLWTTIKLQNSIRRIRHQLECSQKPVASEIKKLHAWIDHYPPNVPATGYTGYYADKDANCPLDQPNTWSEKARQVAAVLDAVQPDSVLDIGANTGWYSLLAAMRGAFVLSVDGDTACMEMLYANSMRMSLRCLPLVVPYERFHEARVLRKDHGSCDEQITLPFAARAQVDLALCLGLYHHLVLGAGYDPGALIADLSTYARRCLILEFISVRDPRITRPENSSPFFHHLGRISSEVYSLEVTEHLLRQCFTKVYRAPSDTPTRTLLIATRE